MTQPEKERREADESHELPMSDVGDAAWAHNRWPTIGIYSGAGIGAMVALVFYPGWLLTITYVVVLAIVGGLLGFAAAKLIYP